MYKQKIWSINKSNPTMQSIISKELGLSPILAKLLINRGLTTVEQIRNFLENDLSDLHNPFFLKDLEVAITRIIQAINEEEKILIYGDYDVDGITATTVLVSALRRLSKNVDYYIPHRLEEGYGLHLQAVKNAYENGYSLIITVDCGISGLEATSWARQNGAPDIIITDHHEPPPELPKALAVIDPKRSDCNYPFKELAGVGVALKVIQALYSSINKKKINWKSYLDLVCLGTIADVVPLLGENRIIVKYGLSSLTSTKKPGLRALTEVCGLKGELNTGHVGFALAPRLNAAGRLGSPEDAVKLLLTEDHALAMQLAAKLDDGNQERKNVEEKVLKAAIQMIEQEPSLSAGKVLVLASDSWHSGVIGLVASRLVERYYRPVLLIALDGADGKGSARSIPGFNMYQALHYCRDSLLGYGGHELAAGFSLEAEKVKALRQAINQYADKILKEEQLTPVIELDGICSLEEINEQIVGELEKLAPFGQCNPSPLLCCSEVKVINYRGVGKDGAHLKLTLGSKIGALDGIGFNMGAYSEILAASEKINVAFVPEINEWQGRRNVQLKVKDLKVEAIEEFPQAVVNRTSLHKNGYLLFQPEFVLNKLIEYKEINSNIFLPDINNQLPMAAPGKGISQATTIVDQRDNPDRINSLLKMELPKLTIIFVGCGFQTIELAQYLWRVRPDLNNEAAYYCLSMSEHEAAQVRKNLKDGRIRVLVTTPESGYSLNLPDLAKVLLYHLPYTRTQWDLVCNILSFSDVPKDFSLVFGYDDLEINKNRLNAVVPERDTLINIYNYFRQGRTAPGQSVEMNISRIIDKLNGNRSGRVSNFMIQLGINVLGELGLIEYQQEGLNYNLSLLPAPNKKLNLRDSITFNWWQKIKEESDSFAQFLLKASTEEIFNT